MIRSEFITFIREKSVAEGKYREIEMHLVPGPLGTLNGYVIFPVRPVREKGYDGILSYVPVHGGITFAKQEGVEMAYGFDTAHHNSRDYPIGDHEWLWSECRKMVDGILKAKELEDAWDGEEDKEKQVALAQQVYDVAPCDGGFHLGIMVNMLCGRIKPEKE
jgi:hypothetical protein